MARCLRQAGAYARFDGRILESATPRVTPGTKDRLARWCKTGGIYSDGMEVAWKISRLLFGRIVERAE